MRVVSLLLIPLTLAQAAGDEPTSDGQDDDIVTLDVDVRGERGRASEARRALAEPAFVTEIHVDAHRGETISLAEVLADAVGVSVRSLGGLGGFASISMRGSPAAQTEILVDGVPLSRIAFSSVDLGTLDFAGFERVDVYRGGVPVDLGGAVLGGAVNLVSAVGPAPDGRRTTVSAGGGSFGARRLRAARGDAWEDGRLLTSLAAGYQAADGDFGYFDDDGTPLNTTDDRAAATRSNNGFTQLDASARARVLAERGPFEAGGRFSFKDQGVPGPAGAQAAQASLRTTRGQVDLQLQRLALLGDPDLDVGLRGYFLGEAQRWQDPEGEIGLGFSDDEITTLAGGLGLLAGYRLSSRQLLHLSLDGRAEDFFETDRADATRPTAEGSRLGGGLGLSDEIVLGDGELVLVPALRLDLESTRGADAQDSIAGGGPPRSRDDGYLTPRLGARWRVTPFLTVKGNLGRYYRSPTVVELFGNRGFVVGNPDLRPETGVSGDVGLVVAPGALGPFDRIYLEGAVFASQAHDSIALLPTSGRAARARNLSDVRLGGQELVVSLRAFRTLTFTGNYTFLDSAQRSPLVSLDGKRLPGRPRSEAYLRIDARRRLAAVELGVWLDASLVAGNFLDEGNLQEVPARRFFGAGLRVAPRPWLAVTLEAKNLFDERVEDVPLPRAVSPGVASIPRAVSDLLGYPLPGRSLYAGLESRF